MSTEPMSTERMSSERMSSESNNSLFIAIFAVLVLVVAGFFGWQHMQRMDQQMATLNQHLETLNQQVASAEQRASQAEERATQAQQEAGRAADNAQLAATREQESAAKAEVALQAEETARQQEILARSERDQALTQAQQAAAAKAEEERLRLIAENDKQKTLQALDQSRLETMEAKAETRRLQKKMESELDRLQAALNRIADTKRTALGLVMTLDSDHIEFDFNKDTLRPENREVLSKIAGVLLTFNDYGVQIFGHTDDVGSVEYNKDLSKRRAETVKHYLVDSGVKPDVLATLGMGKSAPVAEGTDPESRQRNRRVELAIVFSEGEYESIQEESPGLPG